MWRMEQRERRPLREQALVERGLVCFWFVSRAFLGVNELWLLVGFGVLRVFFPDFRCSAFP